MQQIIEDKLCDVAYKDMRHTEPVYLNEMSFRCQHTKVVLMFAQQHKTFSRRFRESSYYKFVAL